MHSMPPVDLDTIPYMTGQNSNPGFGKIALSW
jgi:hypothetical protein